MRFISASIVVPVRGGFVKNGVVAVDKDGTINGVYEQDDPIVKDVNKEHYEGVLVPGFVNAHCHLELSHMLGKTPKGQGLPKFLASVMKTRAVDKKEVISRMEEADALMFKNGIQAVGDHVNTEVSSAVKEKSSIFYHTFVEIMAVNKEDIQDRIDAARDVEFYFNANHTSITPHAPYSCSKELFKVLRKVVSEENILSVHNQESEEENKLFRYKEGEFLEFYAEMGINVDAMKAQARNSIQSFLPYTPKTNKLILVHNTYTSAKDLDFISRQGRDVYLCICPKANLYIEGKLPKVLNFIPNPNRVIVGTDSLASNDTLSILEELKVLVEVNPNLEFLQVLQWATINGAEALGLEDTLGSIEIGKKPGLVLLEGMNNLRLTDKVTLKRIV